MNKGFIKVVCAMSVLALIVAMGAPQVGKRKEGTSGGGGSSTGGGTRPPTTTGGGSGGGTTGSGGSGGSGQRREPPPVRHEPPPGSGTTGGGSSQGGGSQGGGLGRREDRGGGGTSGGTVGGGQIQGRRDGGGVMISGDQAMGRRKTDSRSGQVRYGTTNNETNRTTINGVRIDRPAQIINPGMNRRVLDQERIGLVVNGWRNGYYHYNRNCRDDWFYYPYYVFNPWQSDRYVCSPWYYYPSLPPYLSPSRIIIINVGWPSYNWTGSAYRYDRRNDSNYYDDRYDRNRQELDYALDDLADSWERQDYRAIGRLAPRNGQVHMYFDGRYSYSLGAEDFYDLFVDGIENVRTDRYEIVEVQRGRNGTARVLGKHDYLDPWGRRSSTYHQYFLEPEGRNYVIREFGTSTYRGW